MWIVGTAEYQVGCGSAASAALNFSAEKESRHVTEPPEASVARTDAERPPMWKSGMALRHTSFSEISIVPESSRPFRTIALCRSGTPFGFEVVPDVRKSSTTSSSPVSSGFKSYAWGMVGSGMSSNSPGNASSPTLAVWMYMIFPAALIASAAARMPSAGAFSKRMTCFASNCSIASSASACMTVRSSGAAVHCDAMVRNATAATAPPGAT
mmetsp:Transcript_4100/g.9181  ORF Transcript_4100/g.9181 Transcript_4100/m.9181 type:complete len:211 (+) Transcript_4100:2904-3536(+)